ncbi:MAG: hypothetical protein ACLFQB_13150 [Chitinispirillaceae bacterium]
MRKIHLLLAALVFTGFSLEVNGHFSPDTSLVVTTINEYKTEGRWAFIDREILGYDEHHRKIFRSFVSIGDIEELRYFWKYSEDGVRAEKVTLVETFDSSWTIVGRDSIFSHPLSDTVISGAKLKITNYNEAGRVTDETRYIREDDEWVAQNRVTYEYNQQGDVILFIHQSKQLGDKHLVNVHKSVTTYENERINTSFSYEWSREEEIWVKAGETRYTYTAKNSKLITEKHSLRKTDDEWKNVRRIFDTTGVDGLVTGQLRQKWNGEKWENEQKILFSYDFMGNIVLKLRQKHENSVWTYGERTRYEYAYYLDQEPTKVATQSRPKHPISVMENQKEISLTGLKGVGASINCRIYDLMGRVLFKENIPQHGSNTYKIRKNEFGASGIRIIQLSTPKQGVIYRGRVTY